jgi:NADPH:quinone reductase-like Zn-dependent oxidoreductase
MQGITVDEYRGVPTVTELPDPEPGPDQILIKIGAAGVNPMDRALANGAWQAIMPATFPSWAPIWPAWSKRPATARHASRPAMR